MLIGTYTLMGTNIAAVHETLMLEIVNPKYSSGLILGM